MKKLVLIVVAAATMAGCSDKCVNTVFQQAAAPDGLHNAVIFQRDCGATTGFSTQLSILRAGKQPVGVGNTFRADDDYGAASAGDWGGPWVEMRWLAPDHLLVRYAAKSRIYEQETQQSGVKISYQAIVR